MSTMLSRQISDWAATLRFEDIPASSLVAAKNILFDSLGCAFGGADMPDTKLYLAHLQEMGGTEQATVWVNGWRTNVVDAAFLNALAVRAMDYNDIYWREDPSHPSDIIPGAVALCEMEELSGKELLVGIVLGHEIEMRLCEFAKPGIRERGWHHATLTAYAAPVMAARLLGLDADRMQHAIGIAACRHFTLGAAVAGKLSMMKNTVDPLATRVGVESALLARRGYTGPENVLDGKEGMFHCLGEAWEPNILTDGLGDTFRIEQCGMKAFPVEALTHTPLTALLALLKEHSFQAEDVAKIRVGLVARAADILGDPAKFDPRSKHAADHSMPYCVAAAIVRGKITPEEFEDDVIMDPRIRGLLKKIEVYAVPEFEPRFPEFQPARVTIETTTGQTFEREEDVPVGDPRHPMSPDDLRTKFDALGRYAFTDTRRQQIYDAVQSLESMERVQDLVQLCLSDI